MEALNLCFLSELQYSLSESGDMGILSLPEEVLIKMAQYLGNSKSLSLLKQCRGSRFTESDQA
jgi:hypothetical protein